MVPIVSRNLIVAYPDLAHELFSFRRKINDTRVEVMMLTTWEYTSFFELGDLGSSDVRVCDKMFGGGAVCGYEICYPSGKGSYSSRIPKTINP